MNRLFYSSAEKCLLSDSPFIMSSHLTSKCAGLLSNIPSKQTALWMADINLQQCCENVLCLRAADHREERKRVRFHSWNFCWSSHLKKNVSTPFGAWASQTRWPLPHVLRMCLRLVTHTHTQGRHLRWVVWGFGLSPYPRRSVLYPSASHFLLVDDVHELHGVVAFHVNHRPLQGILSHLVELKSGERKKYFKHNVQLIHVVNNGLS